MKIAIKNNCSEYLSSFRINYNARKLSCFFIVLILILLFFNPVCAQKEANHWYFGNKAGIDFSSGEPVFDTLGKLETGEGCATISDKTTGELLFYTDGMKVWDKTHALMPQGDSLWGHSSSTQSGVIVPKPGSDSLYYVFTADANAGSFGIAYSMIDMSLNGGKGDVTLKNQPLLSPACEKITAVGHCNGTDIWVIVHQWNSNAFYVYQVTSSGINPPVISNTGSIIKEGSGLKNEAIGYLKSSPDGKKLAAANYQKTNTLDLFDFDNTTGIISNIFIDSSFPVKGGEYGPYGVSFSPDNTKLYVSYTYTPCIIYQYDLSAGSPAMMLASRKVIATAPDLSALQLGPGGKIYIAIAWKSTLDLIDNPNASGAACNYLPNAVTLKKLPYTANSVYGLPNFIESFFNNYFLGNDIITCESQVILDAKNTGASYLWSTGETTQIINVTTSGNYWVQVNDQGCIMSDTIKVTFVSSINVNLGKDTIVCDSTYYINAKNTGSTFIWSTGDTTQVIKVKSTGIYSVQVTDGACTASDTIYVNFDFIPHLGNDTVICPGTSITLDAGASGSKYYWYPDEDTTQTITIYNTRRIMVTVTNSQCSSSDVISIFFASPPVANLGSDTLICDTSYVLNAGNLAPIDNWFPGSKFLWSTGETSQTIIIKNNGTYWVKVENGQCSDSDTITVTFISTLTVNLGNDTTLCQTSSYVLDAANPGAKYLWSTGDTTQTIYADTTEVYWVKVQNGMCSKTDTVMITFAYPAIINLGNDTSICDTAYSLNAQKAGSAYLWSTGDTIQNIKINGTDSYWVQVKTGQCIASDTIIITFSSPTVNLGNDTIICGISYILDAADPGARYLWSTGDTTQKINAETSEIYWVKVQNGVCSDADTINITFASPPAVDLGNDTALCEPIMLDAGNAGSLYQWSTGDTSKIITASNTGIYWVKVSNGLCTVNDSIKITFNSILVDLGNDVIACEEKTLDAGNSGSKYLWSTGETSQTITVSSGGTYWVHINNGICSSSDTLQVTFMHLFINLGEDIIACDKELTLDAGDSGKAYLWSTGDTTQSIVITQDGDYWVHISSESCYDADTINVSFIKESPVLFLSNIFTPNNDGSNDVLDFSIENIEDYNLKIFNRWGELVFKTSDKSKSWDGTTTSGNEVPASVYFWVLEYKPICGTGQMQSKKGFVHLVR